MKKNISNNDYENYKLGKKTHIKRLIKDSVYQNLPLCFRAKLYYFYRFIILLGLLDAFSGSSFHYLQGYWYRLLVDLKVREIEKYIKEKNIKVEEAIFIKTGIKEYEGHNYYSSKK